MKQDKGIILAGGYGSRLYPLTLGTSKQLLPVYDTPMIYYPISVFLNAGITNILVITTQEDTLKFQKLLGNGDNIGVNISYKAQKKPNGIAESFVLAEEFIGNDNICLILGDNIFHGQNLIDKLTMGLKNLDDGYSTIFAKKVKYPQNYGVINFDKLGNVISITEKPKNPNAELGILGFET